MIKALIVYETRYGATENTAKIIGEVLGQEEIKVKVVNAKKDKVQSISQFDLVIVGSGIKMGKWTKGPKKFLGKFQKELSKKKIALFVCCGGAKPLNHGEEKLKEIEDSKRKYLEDISVQYNLNPISLGLFGGIFDFNKLSWLLRKTMSGVKPKLEEAGYKESKSGIYDTRSLDTIRNWSKEVAKIVS